jgi:hypothetical protein
MLVISFCRYLGEVTQGALSLQFTNASPKTLFYHRKLLLRKVRIMDSLTMMTSNKMSSSKKSDLLRDFLRQVFI